MRAVKRLIASILSSLYAKAFTTIPHSGYQLHTISDLSLVAEAQQCGFHIA